MCWVQHSLPKVPLQLGSPHSGCTQQHPAQDHGRGWPGAAWGPWAEQKAHFGSSPHRDAQRVEELCAKNQQLREQQKALKENVRVLENR